MAAKTYYCGFTYYVIGNKGSFEERCVNIWIHDAGGQLAGVNGWSVSVPVCRNNQIIGTKPSIFKFSREPVADVIYEREIRISLVPPKELDWQILIEEGSRRVFCLSVNPNDRQEKHYWLKKFHEFLGAPVKLVLD